MSKHIASPTGDQASETKSHESLAGSVLSRVAEAQGLCLSVHQRRKLILGYLEDTWGRDGWPWQAGHRLTTHWPVQHHDSLESVADAAIQGADQIGLAWRTPGLSTKQRGGDEHCTYLPGVFLDIDCREGKHSAKGLPSFEEVTNALLSLPLRPNFIVFTGGGFQAHWRLSAAHNAADLKPVWMGWEGFVATRVKLDERKGVGSLPCRLPYVYNPKYGTDVLPTVVYDDGSNTSLASLREYQAYANYQDKGKVITLPKIPDHIVAAADATGIPWCARGTRGLEFSLCPACLGEAPGNKRKSTGWVWADNGWLYCQRTSCTAHDTIPLEEWVQAHAPSALQQVQDALAGNRSRLLSGAVVRTAQRSLVADASVSLTEADTGVTEKALQKASRLARGTPSPPKISKTVPPPAQPEVAVVGEMETGLGKSTWLAKFVRKAPGAHAIAHRTHQDLNDTAARLEALGVHAVIFQGPQVACQFPVAKQRYAGRADYRQLVCEGCPEKADCPAWPEFRVDAVLLLTQAAIPALSRFWPGVSGGKPFVPLAGRKLWIDEMPPVIDTVTITCKELLEPLARLDQFLEPCSVELVCTLVSKLIQLAKAAHQQEKELNGKAAGKNSWPIRIYGNRLSSLVTNALRLVAPVTAGDRYRLAVQECYLLSKVEPETDSDDFLTRAKSTAHARQLRAIAALAKSGEPRRELDELQDAELTPISALQRLAGLSIANPGQFLPQDLRDGKVHPEELPDPRFVMAWGALLGLLMMRAGPLRDGRGSRNRAGLSSIRAHMEMFYGIPELVVGDHGLILELRSRSSLPVAPGIGGKIVLSATAAYEIEDLKAANGEIPEWVPVGFRVEPEKFTLKNPAREQKTASIWVQTSSAARRWCVASGTVTKRGEHMIRGVVREVVKLCGEHLQHTHKIKIGIITYMAVAKWMDEHSDELDELLPENAKITKLGYYGRDEQASNDFENVDCLVLLGIPRSNLGAIEADARFLCPIRDTQEDLESAHFGNRWTPRQTWMRDHAARRTQRAMLQAIGRARALRAKRDLLLVIVGEETPEDGREWSVRHLPEGAPPGPLRSQVEWFTGLLLKADWPVSAWILRGLAIADSNAQELLLNKVCSSCALPEAIVDIPLRTLQHYVSRGALKVNAVTDSTKSLPKNHRYYRMPSTDPGLAAERAVEVWNVSAAC